MSDEEEQLSVGLGLESVFDNCSFTNFILPNEGFEK